MSSALYLAPSGPIWLYEALPGSMRLYEQRALSGSMNSATIRERLAAVLARGGDGPLGHAPLV